MDVVLAVIILGTITLALAVNISAAVGLLRHWWWT
jgi:hypothetical protein